MIKMKVLLFISLSSLILGACETSDRSPNDDIDSDISTTESVKESKVTKEPGIQELDNSIIQEIEKIGTEEEVDWDKINLNKRQFSEYIESLSDLVTDESDTDEDALSIISSTMIDNETIEIVINNPDKSEMSALTNGFFAIIMDSFIRQLYLSSDFSDGSTHPLIIIKDEENNMVSEASNFIEMESTE
ncbi:MULTISPECIES: hypothetical protein [Jeotgalibaca]